MCSFGSQNHRRIHTSAVICDNPRSHCCNQWLGREPGLQVSMGRRGVLESPSREAGGSDVRAAGGKASSHVSIRDPVPEALPQLDLGWQRWNREFRKYQLGSGGTRLESQHLEGITEAGGFLSSRPACSTARATQSLSQEKKKRKK